MKYHYTNLIVKSILVIADPILYSNSKMKYIQGLPSSQMDTIKKKHY